MRTWIATVAMLLVLASSAMAAAPPVSLGQQQQTKTILGLLGAADLAYMPRYVPPRYIPDESQTSAGQLTFSFSSPKAPGKVLAFAAEPFKGKLTGCSKGSQRTLQVDGKTVYWNAQGSAWRCVRAPSGHIVAVYASSRALTRAELVRVVSSVVRIP